MTELRLIESTLERAARRRRWDRALRGLWRGLLVGALLYLATLATYKLLPVPAWVPTAGSLAVLAAAAVGLLLGGWRGTSLAETARWVDVQQNLKERLSTALEVARQHPTGEWRDLVVADATEHARQVDPRQLVPLSLTRASRWALWLLVLAVGLGFVPEYRSKARLQQQADAKIIKEVGQQLTGLTKQNLEHRKPALETTQKALETVEKVGEQLTRANLTRSDALRDLASATDKLKDQLKELSKDPGLRRLEQAQRAAAQTGQSPGDTQKQMAVLQQQLGEKAASNPEALEKMKADLEKMAQSAKALASKQGEAGAAARQQLSQSLSALAQQAAQLGLKIPDLDQAMAALAANQTDLFVKDLQAAMNDLEKLSELAKDLQKLQAQAAEKMGKDLAEQLKNGQAEAAQATLQKMIDQLKSAGLTQEQLQKLLAEVSKAIDPASPYGKVAEHLKDAARQMQQGKKPDAAQSLANAAKELDNLMQQFGDAQSMMAALDALKQGSWCVGTGQGWGLCKKPGLGPGGKPGQGVGTWADDDGSASWDGQATELVDNSGFERPDEDARGVSDRGEATLNDALKPTKVSGKFSPGAPMPSITLKGVSIKGTSKLQYEEAATAAQTEAQSALSQDKVPRAYQNAVRDYFDDLKK
jgi:hypothetical protein